MKRSLHADDQNAPPLGWRLWPAVLLCAAALCTTAGRAQALDPPRSPAPPELEGPTYAAEMIAALEEEIAHFGRLDRSADETQRIVIRASLNWRIIAAELLAQAEDAGRQGSISALFGFRLAHSRGEMDALLIGMHRELDRKVRQGDSDMTPEAAALAALNRFNDAAIDLARSIRTVEAGQLDRALAEIFAPLAEAVTPFAGAEPVNHWPPRTAVRADATMTGEADQPRPAQPPVDASDEIRRCLAAAELDDELRRALGEALLALEAAARGEGPPEPAKDAQAAREAIGNLLAACEGMIAYRRLGKVEPPRDLRAIVNRLEAGYQTAEKALLAQIERLADDPDALTDPAFASLLADQARYLADLKRVRDLPARINLISRIDPSAAGPFENRMRKMSQWLLDPNRRANAARTMDEFPRQAAMFYPMPFEAELAAADSTAITATGGLNRELLDLILFTRRQWAQDWAMGEESEQAARRLLLLHRLTRTMVESAELLGGGGEAEILNRWAAWEIPKGLLKRSALDLPNRLKLATAAATQGDDASLAAELDQIDREAAMTRLVGRLAIVFADALQPLPDGVAGVLGQVLFPPTEEAWMIEHRRDLAELCRYTTEAHHAWFEQREADARALQHFVNAKAEELVGVISDE